MPQFAFLPYFPKDSIDLKINRVHLFNFARFGETYIPNADLRKRMDEYCSLYVDSAHRRLDNLTIVVIDNNYGFDPLSDEQVKDLFRYAIALMFCSILKNEQNSVCVSEQFNMAVQPFTIELSRYDFISFETGSYFRTLNTQSLEMTKFVRPSFVPRSDSFYQYDSLLMVSLANMTDAHNPDDSRYFRVLDWVRYAHFNADGYSPESRLVMMATAFEIFFDLPRYGKEDAFASRLETLLGVDKMEVRDEDFNLIQTGLTPITKKNASNKDKTNTAYGWWARDFYDLRSKIVHGQDINNNDIKNYKGENHFVIALKMLRFCFYRLLESKGYLTYKMLTEIPSFENMSWERIHAEEELREIEQLI